MEDGSEVEGRLSKVRSFCCGLRNVEFRKDGTQITQIIRIYADIERTTVDTVGTGGRWKMEVK